MEERGPRVEAMKVIEEEGGEGVKEEVAEVEEEKMEKEGLEELEEVVSQETHQAEEEEGAEGGEEVALRLLSLANPQVGNITQFFTPSCLRRNWWWSKGCRKRLGRWRLGRATGRAPKSS